jgi:hypothetical protein
MPVQIIPHHTSMQNYLVIAHHTDNNENLDWIVSTTDARRAVELWRENLIEKVGFEAEDIAELTAITDVVLLPPVSSYDRVWDWEGLSVPGWKAE